MQTDLISYTIHTTLYLIIIIRTKSQACKILSNEVVIVLLII